MADNEELFRDSQGSHALPRAAHEHRMSLERLGASDPYELRAIVAEQRAQLDDLDELAKKILAYEAGMDATPRDEASAFATPGQLWHALLTAPEHIRAILLESAIMNADAARACFQQDHREVMLRAERQREGLADAIFDHPTDDSHESLLVSVRALRQVMVDGIARRSTTVVGPTDEDYPADLLTYDEDFPVEADVKAKIGEQLKSAGIDLQSICNFEWVGEATPLCPLGAHKCGAVNPLHALAHGCKDCSASLTHEDAERLATQ